MQGGIRMARAAAAGCAAGTLGVAVALLASPAATADDEVAVGPPAPQAVVEVAPAPASAAASATQGVVAAVSPAAAGQAAPSALAPQITPPDGVPHLPSPEHLPPGTTAAPADGAAPTESATMGYLRDLWHAVQNNEVTMGDAILLFAQRPMDSKGSLHDMTPQQGPVAAPAPAPDQSAPAAELPPDAAGAVPSP